MTESISPCQYCTRVRDPQNCENKNCKPWREWFFLQWEQTRKLYRKGMDITGGKCGIPLGGERYESPHRVTEYLETDPCDVCKLPMELCHKPCKRRLEWNQIHEEVIHELESGSNG